MQEGHPNVLDYVIDGNLHLVINTPSGKGRGPTRAASAPRPSRTASRASPRSGRRGRGLGDGGPRSGRDDRAGRARPLPELRPKRSRLSAITRVGQAGLGKLGFGRFFGALRCWTVDARPTDRSVRGGGDPAYFPPGSGSHAPRGNPFFPTLRVKSGEAERVRSHAERGNE